WPSFTMSGRYVPRHGGVTVNGANFQMASGINTDSVGNVVVTGYFYGSIDFGAGPIPSDGPSDLYVVKLDPAGKRLWNRQYGDEDEVQGGGPVPGCPESCFQVAVDGSDNILLGGYFGGTIALGAPFTSS